MRIAWGNTKEGSTTVSFGLAEPIEGGDLVINELLFNPETGGSDFLEIYNNSNKILNLGGLILANTLSTSSNAVKTVENDLLILPDSYVVFSPDPLDIAGRYFVENPKNLIENSLPTLLDKDGNITIVNPQFDTIDAFNYSEDLHFSLLDDKNGVSLERLDPNASTQNNGNWHSAAASVGFATPTAKNSQFFELTSTIDRVIDFPYTTFSPDEDGFEDILLINYEVDQPGYLLNINIFDSNGRPVKQLIRNELLANSGVLKWDGSDDEGLKSQNWYLYPVD